MKLHELLDVIGGIPVSITDVGRWKKICEDKTAFDVFDLPEYQEVKDFKVVQVEHGRKLDARSVRIAACD